MSAIVGSAYSAKDAVALAPLPPKMGAVLANGYCLAWRATLFFGASAKGLHCLLTLQETKNITHDEIHPKKRKQGN